MRCNKCNEEMFNATLTGNTLYPLILSNKKKGILEPEKRCYVLCYVCPECGYIELYAEKPKELKIDWQCPICRADSVECWCDFGANLVQHFMRRYSRYSRYRTKTHDKSTISHVFPRYSQYQTVLLKLQEIISTFGRIQKMLRFFGAFFYLFENNYDCPSGKLSV